MSIAMIDMHAQESICLRLSTWISMNRNILQVWNINKQKEKCGMWSGLAGIVCNGNTSENLNQEAGPSTETQSKLSLYTSPASGVQINDRYMKRWEWCQAYSQFFLRMTDMHDSPPVDFCRPPKWYEMIAETQHSASQNSSWFPWRHDWVRMEIPHWSIQNGIFFPFQWIQM